MKFTFILAVIDPSLSRKRERVRVRVNVQRTTSNYGVYTPKLFQHRRLRVGWDMADPMQFSNERTSARI